MSDNGEQRVRIVKGPCQGREGVLDGASQLQQAYRVQFPHESFSRVFPIEHVELLPRPEPVEWR